MAGNHELSRDFQLRGDPEVTSTQADYEARTGAALRGRELQTRLNGMITSLVDLRIQIEGVQETVAGKGLDNEAEVLRMAGEALQELQALEDELRRPPPRMGYRQYPRLSEQLSFATRGITQAQARPTDGQLQVMSEVEEAMNGRAEELRGIVAGPVAALNRLLGGESRILVGGGGR